MAVGEGSGVAVGGDVSSASGIAVCVKDGVDVVGGGAHPEMINTAQSKPLISIRCTGNKEDFVIFVIEQ